MTKYIFVTGGVVSSLGKGIVAASLGRLLKNRGLNVTIQKFDPYINVDPGTMSPYQHGEVFVTDDGAETDLDLGHYERFIDINLNKFSNVTTGKIYSTVLKKNDAETTLAELYRLSRTSQTNWKTVFTGRGKKQTRMSSLQKLAVLSETSNHCHSLKRFAKWRAISAVKT